MQELTGYRLIDVYLSLSFGHGNPLLQRITVNPDICHGKPTIRNKRYTVGLILDLLSAGSSHEEILEEYPSLEDADILACLAYASRLAKYSGYTKISI